MKRGRYRGIPWEIEENLGTSPGFGEWTAQRVSHVAHANLTRGQIPTIESTGVVYQRDPDGCDLPVPWWQAVRNGSLDCKTASAWELARRYQQRGRWPVGQVVPSGAARLAHVRLSDDDPSMNLVRAGKSRPGRRPWTKACDIAARSYFGPGRTPRTRKPHPPAPAAGSWPEVTPEGDCSCQNHAAGAEEPHRDEALLHWQLRALLKRGRDAGLPVYLNSGHRPVSRQVMLWETRMKEARAAGEKGVPPSWRAVENDFARWAPWVIREYKGENGRPYIAFPGVSNHQRLPSLAADISSRRRTRAEVRADQAKLAEIGSDLAHRPIPGEPWHFEPRDPTAPEATGTEIELWQVS